MKDEKRHIATLLNRFLEGESTLAEEEQLAQYFATHSVDREWEPYKQMFAYFDSGMDDTSCASKPKIVMMPWRRVIGIAASVAIAVGIDLSAIYFNFRNGDQDVPEIADITMANAGIEDCQDNNVSVATLHPQIIAEKPLTVNNRVKQRATTEEEEAEYRVKVAEEEYAQRKAEEELWAENVIAVTYALQEQELLELQRQIDMEYEQKYLASMPAPQVIEVP